MAGDGEHRRHEVSDGWRTKVPTPSLLGTPFERRYRDRAANPAHTRMCIYRDSPTAFFREFRSDGRGSPCSSLRRVFILCLFDVAHLSSFSEALRTSLMSHPGSSDTSFDTGFLLVGRRQSRGSDSSRVPPDGFGNAIFRYIFDEGNPAA